MLQPVGKKSLQDINFGSFLFACLCWLAIGIFANAAGPLPPYAPLGAELTSVPQTLLNLIHTPQVQAELRIPAKQLEAFLPALQKIDGPWWRARILPEANQRTIVAQQENLLIGELQKRFGVSAVQRLRQLELQSQGFRMLLRPEIVAHLELSGEQTEKLTKLFGETDAIAAKIREKMGQADSELTSQFEAARKSEMQTAPTILNAAQQNKAMLAIGKMVDVSKFERIYPLAPELIDSGTWTTAERPRLSQLRGKVVLVHFYAFQCHNCQANFHIYNRWHKSLADKGVHLIGIQTPETSTERDAEAVTRAAVKDGFQFPVLIDLKSANWDAWSNTMWPTVYVIDKQGYIRFWWQGELNWQGATVDQKIEKLVDQLLAEQPDSVSVASNQATAQ